MQLACEVRGPPYRLLYTDVALLLPCRIHADARKLKEDALEACTDCSKRWLDINLPTISLYDIIEYERCPSKNPPGHFREADSG